jgi:hypothetical protein
MAGYSQTPLAQKLGIKPGFRIVTEDAPANYAALLAPLPDGALVVKAKTGRPDMVHLFVTEARRLKALLENNLKRIFPDGVIWVSWPKKAARKDTDVTEDVIRSAALPLGLVDIKVCAIDETWSGLKLVVRKNERKRQSMSKR